MVDIPGAAAVRRSSADTEAQRNTSPVSMGEAFSPASEVTQLCAQRAALLMIDTVHLSSHWHHMSQWMIPFEHDRQEYLNTAKYPPDGCRQIEVRPALAARLLELCDMKLSNIAGLMASELGLELVRTVVSGPAVDPAVDVSSGRLSEGDECCVSGTVSPNLPVRALNAEEIAFIVRPAALPTAVAMRDTAPGAVSVPRRGNVLHSRFSPLMHSQGLRAGGGVPYSAAVAATQVVSAPQQQPRVLFEDEGSPIDRIRELEAEVRELSRQLKTFQAEQRSSNTTSPTNQVVITSIRPAVVPAGVATTVRLVVSSLDADSAPYSIKIGRSIVPCVVTERRVLSFVTPPLPPGSTAIQVMCTTAQGSVRRYGRAVWLESKQPSTRTVVTTSGLVAESFYSNGAVSVTGAAAVVAGPRLTRHAVNQISSGPDVPVTVSTMHDPSEAGRSAIETATAKSEYEDTTSDPESQGLQQTNDLRVPLTREMLAMISGRMARSVGSDTNSEAVASTILTLHMNSAVPQDTASAPSTGDPDEIVESGLGGTAGDDMDEAASGRGMEQDEVILF